jgi:hypothetical protein
MLTWSRGGVEQVVTPFEGTISSLIYCYTHDPDSPFHKLRYASRRTTAGF